MEETKTRISVDLTETTIKVLRLQAKADGRLLKNYVEKVLRDLAERKKTKIDVKK